MKLSALVVPIAVTLAPSVVSAQQTPAACSLLTRDEVGNAAGTKAQPGRDAAFAFPDGPQKGATLASCSWHTDNGNVTLSVMPAPPANARDTAPFQQAAAKLRDQGWTEENVTTVEGVRCGAAIPPKSRAGELPVTVNCTGEAKGWAVSVSTLIPKTKVPVARVRALYDDAVNRLP